MATASPAAGGVRDRGGDATTSLLDGSGEFFRQQNLQYLQRSHATFESEYTFNS